MNKWKTMPIGLGILLVFFCSGVLAQTQAPPRAGRDARPDPRMEQAVDMMFQDMDTNHDGSISKKEWMAAQEKQFSRLDRNGDGFITRDEVLADMMERMRERPRSPERGKGSE
jgi:Ca2+-binding EF-hand superfamily protein